jgi:hypothetical protein|tara:strand:- start:325 stop:534 length:210 start_codon:yes stop_codon:yes gene_type:complete
MNKNILQDFKYENKKKKAIKYILFSLILYILIKYVPNIKISNNKNLIICVISMISYTILDINSPSITIN